MSGPDPMPQKTPPPTEESALLDLLRALDITWATHRHAPVMTVAEAKALRGGLDGAHIKNLFLRDRRKRHFLVTALEDRPIDLKKLRLAVGARGNLSFASADALRELLGLSPGAVTPLAAMNDRGGRVTVVLDAALRGARAVNCHPLHNAATIGLAADDLVRFLEHTGHPPAWVDFEPLAPDPA